MFIHKITFSDGDCDQLVKVHCSAVYFRFKYTTFEEGTCPLYVSHNGKKLH